MSQYYQQIWAQIAAIPTGRVTTYGRIAERAGLPRRARLVAQALRNAPSELALPWFRVLRADGRIAPPEVHSGHDEQVAQLLAEGVLVKVGRVDLDRFGWSLALDELLWSPDS